MKITVKGLNENIEKFKDIPEQLDAMMEDVAKKSVKYAQDNAPIGIGEHAGNMRKEIEYKKIPNGYEIICSVVDRNGREYAHFNEYGSPFTPVGSFDSPIKSRSGGYRPFIRPAILKARDEAYELFRKKWYKRK